MWVCIPWLSVYMYVNIRVCLRVHACVLTCVFQSILVLAWPQAKLSRKQPFPVFPLPKGEKGLICSPLERSLHSYWSLQLCTDQA